MSRSAAAVFAICCALPALGQEPPPPAPVEESGTLARCFGVPRAHGHPPIGAYGEIPIGTPGGGGSTLPLASSSGDTKAWLIVAVLAVAALPIVVYVVDTPPPALVLRRYQCPTFTLDLATGPQILGQESGVAGSGRFGFAIGAIGTDLQLDFGPVSSLATHLLLRPSPKKHVDLSVALGYRRSVFRGQLQDGLELGLPHRYTFSRELLQSVALELRPMLAITGQGIEPSLEAAFLIPVADVLHLRLGGRAFTFNGAFFWGVSGGLGLTL